MPPKKLLKPILDYAKSQGWSISTRQGSTTHLVVTIFDQNGRKRTSVISVHKGKDLSTYRCNAILKQLGISK